MLGRGTIFRLNQTYPGNGRGRVILVLVIAAIIGSTIYLTMQEAKTPQADHTPVRKTARGQ